MKTVSLFFAMVGVAMMAACSVGTDTTGDTSDAVVLDVRCAADADCPDAYECEIEVEHGVETSYCVSHEGGEDGDGSCPDGFELEEEHGETFCKPHGGDDSEGGGGNGGSGGHGGSSNSGDCPPGYELEVEHGETFCKPHGGTDD